MPPTIAHYNGTLIWHPASTPPKLVVTLPSGTLQWHPGTQRWHPGTQQWHPAPSNGTTSTPPKLVVTLPSGTLQWHPAMAPRHPAMAPRHPAMAPSTQQWHHVHSSKVGHHPPPNHSTLQWHPAVAPRPLPQSWPSPSPPTISHYNGTPRKHPAMAPRPLHPAMAPWCHVQSAKLVRRPPPLLEVRTPIAIAIWGKTVHRNVRVSFAILIQYSKALAVSHKYSSVHMASHT